MKIWKKLGKGRRTLRLIVIICLVFSIALAAGMSQWIRAATWPLCDFNCTANDVELSGAWIGDITGAHLEPCAWGDPVEGYLWGNITNTTGTDRYAVWTLFEMYVNEVQQGGLFETCIVDMLSLIHI